MRRPAATRGARSLAALLAALALADVLHDGAHPSAGGGWYVIALVVADGRPARASSALASGAAVARRRSASPRWCSSPPSWSNGLDRLDQWFERARGDPIAEYQIVAKEGLELLGWSLVALALWDEALCRRRALTVGYSASFSSTGSIETTCRLKRSSESVRPAATPISCER